VLVEDVSVARVGAGKGRHAPPRSEAQHSFGSLNIGDDIRGVPFDAGACAQPDVRLQPPLSHSLARRWSQVGTAKSLARSDADALHESHGLDHRDA
jgi:hypothetical protein